MRKYTILHAPLLSFFSKSLYQDVARNWRGTGLLYLLVLLAACWAALAFKLYAGIATFARATRPLAEKLPPITIRQGVAEVSEPQPYTIHDPRTGRPAIIIDTTGQVTALEDTGATVLLTRTRLIPRNGEASEIALSRLPDFYVDGPIATKWLDWARRWLALTAYPFALLFSYLYRILQALLYAAIGLAFAAIVRGELSFQAAMRLAVVATTPAIILNTIVLLIGLTIPFWWPICFVMAMGYLYLGVKATFEPTGGGIPTSPDIPTFSQQ